MRQIGRRVVGLALSCHLGPALAVTALATALAIGVGASPPRWTLIAAAVLAGQLSVGWSNDWIDAGRDTAVGRRDKPVAAGLVPVGAVRTSAVVAAGGCVPLSLALGWRAGVVHLVAVAAAWGYNVRLKSTPWSWVPYALSFGLLPAVVTLALPAHSWPPAWVVGAAGLLGVGAHLANVVPDLEADRSTGVRGLPHRLGQRGSVLLAPTTLLGATALIVLGPPGAPAGPGWAGLTATAALGISGAVVALTRPHSHAPFYLTIAVAAVDVVLLVLAGPLLV